MNNKTVIFNHIPKTAGLTLSEIMKNNIQLNEHFQHWTIMVKTGKEEEDKQSNILWIFLNLKDLILILLQDTQL